MQPLALAQRGVGQAVVLAERAVVVEAADFALFRRRGAREEVLEAPHEHWVYAVKPRYRQAAAPCEIEHVAANGCRIRFAAPQWAVTPGQSVVVYESRVCLGGGVIR
jgi:tRNA U34 2-thiouridine synthase MnmA/TrmU